MSSQTDEFLEHFGVMGMRWGVRKDESAGEARQRPSTQTEMLRDRHRLESASFRKSDNARISKGKALKEMQTTASRIRREEQDKEYKKIAPQLDRIERQAMALAKKYNLDTDDGGGGDDTPEANAAGRKYMDLWEQRDRLERNSWVEADKNLGRRLEKRYGKDTLAEMKSYSKKRSLLKGAAVVAGVLAFAAAPVVIDLL